MDCGSSGAAVADGAVGAGHTSCPKLETYDCETQDRGCCKHDGKIGVSFRAGRPLLSRGGVDARSRKSREATLAAQTGWCWSKNAWPTPPCPLQRGCFATF